MFKFTHFIMKKDVYAIRSNLGFLNVLGFIMLFIGDKMKSVVFHFSLIPFFIALALGVYIVVKNWSFKKNTDPDSKSKLISGMNSSFIALGFILVYLVILFDFFKSS